MTDTMSNAVLERSSDLTEQYTDELNAFVEQRVPMALDNTEYAARCSGLMIALNRQLARCAAAFGEANEVPPESIRTLVMGQFSRNFGICIATVRGEGREPN